MASKKKILLIYTGGTIGMIRSPEGVYTPFDFTHFEQVTSDQLGQMEQQVNQWIMQNDAVTTYPMDLKDVPESGIIAVCKVAESSLAAALDVRGTLPPTAETCQRC